MIKIRINNYFATLFFVCIVFFLHAQQLETENLGANINSKYSELNPIISADGKTLYFIRSNHPENIKGDSDSQDIWYSTKDEQGIWQPAKHADVYLNRQDYNTLFNVSSDGNKMLISGPYSDGINSRIGYSFLTRNGNVWNDPQFLHIKKWESRFKGLYSSACMAFDNKTLIISFSEKEESPINDLYVSFLQPNGRWSEPTSLGDTVNTKDDETTPFLAADGISLYFSSNRKGGLGSNDIYLSKRLDNTWRKWSKPINLGAPINTKDWDAYYTIPASGDLAYLVSYQNSLGKGDIVRVKTKSITKPKPVILIKGKVLDAKTNLPVEAEITYEILPSGEKIGVADFISKNGDYVLVLPYGKDYGITAKAIGYIPISLHYDLTIEDKYKEIRKDLMLVPFEKGSVIRLNNLFFDSGKATLKKESYPEIERLIQLLKDNADVEIEIAGHTDDVGSNDDNLILSGNRSAAVKEYIVSKGIKEGRINCRGYGEYKSIVKNDTEENRQLNRRVEFKIITK